MDPSSVLLALQEQEKWRERRKRIEERIRQIDRNRAYLIRELEHARKKTMEFGAIVSALPETPTPTDRATMPPSRLG